MRLGRYPNLFDCSSKSESNVRSGRRHERRPPLALRTKVWERRVRPIRLLSQKHSAYSSPRQATMVCPHFVSDACSREPHQLSEWRIRSAGRDDFAASDKGAENERAREYTSPCPTEGGPLRQVGHPTMPCAHAAPMGTRQSRRFDTWPTALLRSEAVCPANRYHWKN